jgi:hypothetical protein
MPQSVRRRAFGSAIVAALTMASAMLWPAPANAQLTFKIDHFWCYPTTNVPVGRPVLLQDQFDKQISPTFHENVIVVRPVRFCNPVSKLVEATGVFTPITNRESHLKIYRMWVDDLDLAPTRKVKIANQFGTRTIQTLNQEVLAVPTQKNTEGPPHDLDHFKCYRAYGANVNKIVTLRDQFQIQTGLKVTNPFAFCNPTEKIHDNPPAPPVTPITNAEDHLVCYLVTRKPFIAHTVVARNQFGIETLNLSRPPDLLCVPTKKLKVTPL